MLLAAVSVVSAAVLAYEVLLVRLFAIVQWHHFAYMAISIALLGFGASGTFIALARQWLGARFHAVFAVAAVLFGLTAPAAFVLAERLPFNALEIVWDPAQLLYLALLYGLLMVPFFCGATCIGLALACFGSRIGAIYGANLLGSGLGSAAVVGALFVLAPPDVLRAVAGLGIAAAALACLDGAAPRRRLAAFVLLVAALGLPLAVPASWTALRLSPYKGLSRALDVPGAHVVDRARGPLAVLAVVASPTIPFRYVPGLSLRATGEPPPQLGLYADGESAGVITRFDGRLAPLRYLDDTLAALPYHLIARPRVLVLGAGGGADVLQALLEGAARVDAVELDPNVVRLVRDRHGAFAGHLYDLPEVRLHVTEARAFVAGTQRRWDVIAMPLLDSFAASAAGVTGLSESYVYTVEAFRRYLRHLAPGGVLAVTRWLKLPPRDGLKLFATALDALAAEGAAAPPRHLALLRSWNTVTLLVAADPLGEARLAAIRAFAAARSFDLAYLPGLRRDDANRWNILDVPYFFDGAQALAGPGRADFLARYKFDIRPATDDRPYFFDFFRWRALPEFLRLRARGGAGLLEWGYPILFATLVQAAVLSAVFVLLPLAGRRGRRQAGGGARRRVGAYFLALGLAFLFVEIAFIQRFIVFLGHPVAAVAVVLAAFLVFAGLGSALAPRLARWAEARAGPSPVVLAVVAIAGLALVYLAILPPLFEGLLARPDLIKATVAVLLIAPLGTAMGMPFPLGLARVSAGLPDLVPWAWAVNGCASVLSAVLATILAIHFGFTAVVVLAVLLYGAAAAVFRRPLVAD